MKKLVKMMACLLMLCGCSNDGGKSFETTTYTYVDTRPDTIKQFNMTSLDTEIETIDDFKNYSDLIFIGTISEVQNAQVHDERFRTPFDVDSLEIIKGEAREKIYLDGGRMSLADYESQMIDGYLNKDSFALFKQIYPLESSYVMIIPVNYVDLEAGKTYLFFVKDEMIVNGGYGVFEKTDEDTYQNVITKENIQLDQVK